MKQKIRDYSLNRKNQRKVWHDDAQSKKGKLLKAVSKKLRALKARKNRKNNEKALKAKGLFYV